MSKPKPARLSLRVYALAFLVVTLVPILAEEPQYDVRRVRWGMSVKQVKEAEAVEPTYEPAYESPNGNSYFLVYENLTRIAGGYFDVRYGFKNNRLSYAIFTHFTTADEGGAEDAIRLASIILKTLKDKYDAVSRFPGELWATWHNDLYRDRPDMRNIAIALGHVSFEALWFTDRTAIALNLRKYDEKTLELTLFYAGRENAVYQDEGGLL